jgi:hypothetical protein
MNITEQAELIIREAESKLAVLANEYAREVIHPFCDKYDLVFAQFDYTWYFYFREPQGRYPYAIDGALLNWLKSGYDLADKEEEYLKYETSLNELSYDFMYGMDDIYRVIDDRLYMGQHSPLGIYIPRYPTVQ